jgi:NAD(P)-dependent dehydrogenase (short-subunit alcohol dehydrogenase family)
LFEKEYPNIEFVAPGTTVNNLYAMYRLGWFYDKNKEPVLPNTIPLQQTATNILGLPYKEIKPRLAYKKSCVEGMYITIATNSTAGCKFWTREHWQEVINLNLTSVFQCMMGILPGMRQQGEGTIINIASTAAKQAFPGWGAYCVSKAGLVSLSQTLAQEERANGIRVIAICPGSVNTEIWDTPKVHANFDRSRMLTPEIVAATILHAVLLPQDAVIQELTIMSNAGVL